MDDLSSTESEGYDGDDTGLQSAPAPPASNAGFNILDLQVALATQPPALPTPAAPEPDVFVIPRRPVAAAASSAPSRSDAPSHEGEKRHEPPSVTTKKKRKRVQKVPRIRAKHADRAPRQGHRQELPAADRTKLTLQEWRDRRGQREAAPLREWAREEKEQEAPGQRTELTWQERWTERKRLYEQTHEPPPPRTLYPPRAAALRAQEEWRQPPPPGDGNRAQRQQNQRPTTAEKKQRKRQRRMETMAEIDRNPPPPRMSHPRREAAVRAQEEWRHQPQPDGAALLASRRRQEERGELLRRAQDASSRSGYSQHSQRSHYSSHR